MKVAVDRSACAGLGVCESIAPEVFEVDDDGRLELKSAVIGESRLDDVRMAVAGCPNAALRLAG